MSVDRCKGHLLTDFAGSSFDLTQQVSTLKMDLRQSWFYNSDGNLNGFLKGHFKCIYIGVFKLLFHYSTISNSNHIDDDWQVSFFELIHDSNKFLGHWGSGCGSVGKAVASDTTGPRFESSHWQKFIYILNIFLLSTMYWKEKIKKKRPGMAHFLKKQTNIKDQSMQWFGVSRS